MTTEKFLRPNRSRHKIGLLRHFAGNSENMKNIVRYYTLSSFYSSIEDQPWFAAFWEIKPWITIKQWKARVSSSPARNTENCSKGQKSVQMVTFKASKAKFMKHHPHFCKFPPQLWGCLFCQKIVTPLLFEKSTKTFYYVVRGRRSVVPLTMKTAGGLQLMGRKQFFGI